MTTVSTFSSPVLYHKIAQEINSALNNMFTDMYGVVSFRSEEDTVIPEIYKNDGSKVNFRVMPDKQRSLSFFTIEGDMTELDEMDFNCPMGFVFWVNLQKYNKTKAYDYGAELVRDVYNVLNDYGCADISVNVNTPFEDFSGLEKGIDESTMRPYFAAKITFNKSVRICYPQYGTELHTSSNAAADPNDTEAEATSGWFAVASTMSAVDSHTRVGSYAIKAETNTTPLNGGRVQYLKLPLVSGTSLHISCDVRHVGTGGEWIYQVDGGGGFVEVASFNSGDTEYSRVTYDVTLSTTVLLLDFRENNDDNTGGVYIDNLSIREVI